MSRSRLLLTGLSVLLIVSVATAQPPAQPGGGTRGGPGGPPQPGQILPGVLQDQLNLTPEQKKQLEELQKEVDAKLAKILTAEQKKTMQEMQDRFASPGGPGGGGIGPFGPGGFGGRGPGGGGGF